MTNNQTASSPALTPERKKTIWSWALYDLGNSTYSTTIMAGFFPLFFKSYWSAGADAVVTTARLGDLTALTSLIVAVITPLLGALADTRQAKKVFLAIFTAMGLLGCFALGFINMGEFMLAGLMYSIATIGYNSSATFYDSLLPSVAPGKLADRASALGYGLGYLGGGTLFLINVLMYKKPELFGIADGPTAIKYSFMMVAIWWGLFALPLFRNVPEPKTSLDRLPMGVAINRSFQQLRHTSKNLWADRNLRYFMIAFWLYIDGVYTVMTMSVDFGLSIGFKAPDLIGALLLVQFIGFPCAIAFGRLSERFSSKLLIQICIAGYGLVTIMASLMTEVWHFYALAAFIGLVQGGVQALSRSLFCRMIPADKSGEYFGVMNLIGRFAAILGPFLIARATMITGSHRLGLMSLIILLGLGSWFLYKVKTDEIPESI